jgi:hypothetical protein
MTRLWWKTRSENSNKMNMFGKPISLPAQGPEP